MKNSNLDLQGLFNQITTYYTRKSMSKSDDTEVRLKFLNDIVSLWEVTPDTNEIVVKSYLSTFGLKWILQDVFNNIENSTFIKDPEAVAYSVYEELLAHNQEVAKKLSDKFSSLTKMQLPNTEEKIKDVNYVELTLSSFEERYLDDVEGKAQLMVSECKAFIEDVREFKEDTVKVVLFCRKDSSKNSEKIKIGIFNIINIDEKARLATLRSATCSKKEIIHRLSDYLKKPKSKKDVGSGAKVQLKFYRETKSNDVQEFKTTIPLGEDENLTPFVSLSYTVSGIKSVVYPTQNKKTALLANALSTTFSTDEWSLLVYAKSEWYKVLNEGLTKARSKTGKKSMTEYLNSIYCEVSIIYAGGKEKIICAHGQVYVGELTFSIHGYPSFNIRKERKQLYEGGCSSSDCEIEFTDTKVTEPAIDYSYLEYEELD